MQSNKVSEVEIIHAGSDIAAYNEFRSQLANLQQENSKLVFNYEDPAGNKAARSHVYKLRQTRAAVDETRKREKAASLEYGRKVDSEAKDIMEQITAMIDIHAKPLEAIEQREKDRIAEHEADLVEIITAGTHTAERWMNLTVEAIRDRMAEIEVEPLTAERWQEFLPRAVQAIDTTLSQMRAAILRREKHDDEQAELERLRREAADRAQRDREDQIRRDAEANARAQAEAAAKAEREAAERRERELKAAAEQAERDRVAAEERAATAAREAEERVRREAAEAANREAAEAAKREADTKHRAAINNAAVVALVKGGVTKDVAKLVVTIIAKGQVPNVSIAY